MKTMIVILILVCSQAIGQTNNTNIVIQVNSCTNVYSKISNTYNKTCATLGHKWHEVNYNKIEGEVCFECIRCKIVKNYISENIGTVCSVPIFWNGNKQVVEVVVNNKK